MILAREIDRCDDISIFPELHGLGHSAMAMRYSIGSLAEARAYFAHSLLGPRLIECTRIVLAIEGRSPARLHAGRSPESNGIAEAFVKTLKRDYARVTLLSDGRTILGLVSAWIEDYNTSHPHSGLRMLSPREFRARCA